MKDQMTRKSRDKGSILILSLWTVVFLTFIAVMLGGSAGTGIRFSGRIEDISISYDLASSGMLYAIRTIAAGKLDTSPSTDALNDQWANDPSIFGEVKLGEGSYGFAYDKKDDSSGQVLTYFGMVDEERKLNLNYADREEIVRLLLELTDMDQVRATELAASIIDWRDVDDILYNTVDSASERAAYVRAALAYAPANENFHELGQLMFVNGMDPKVFVRIRDYVTVHSTGRININTATAEVLVAIGLSSDMADKVKLFRAGQDGTEGTYDDNVFTSVNKVSGDLEGHFALTDAEKDEITRFVATGKLSVRSDNFMAVCTGHVAGAGTSGKVISVFDRNGNIKYWGYVSLAS
ncbi:MAG: type II secretion system protein GspK [Candidatus Omnitrophica bacterium]|nr:type II secretion system protein GspK [Candidatus Omnitrophota bacterium]MDD5488747.1 type II secretion system protein GspK [Candidatus Omnitrophota bacterium]